MLEAHCVLAFVQGYVSSVKGLSCVCILTPPLPAFMQLLRIAAPVIIIKLLVRFMVYAQVAQVACWAKVKGSLRLSQRFNPWQNWHNRARNRTSRRRHLSRTNTSYPVLSPAFRSDKVVPASYCRLGVATQVLVSSACLLRFAWNSFKPLSRIRRSTLQVRSSLAIEKHILACQVLPITVLTALQVPVMSCHDRTFQQSLQTTALACEF